MAGNTTDKSWNEQDLSNICRENRKRLLPTGKQVSASYADQSIIIIGVESMEYRDLPQDEFDAIVTGELTHYAIWLEGLLNEMIVAYFITDERKRADFERLILYRDGLTFQDKLEIVRAMAPLIPETRRTELKQVLADIEKFKSWRNALAHGLSICKPDEGAVVRVEIVGRSGKPKVIEITPESHEKQMRDTEALVTRAGRLISAFNKK